MDVKTLFFVVPVGEDGRYKLICFKRADDSVFTWRYFYLALFLPAANIVKGEIGQRA